MKRRLDESREDEPKRQNDTANKNRELTTVVVSNLPKSYNQSKIHKCFQDCGIITHIDITESVDGRYRLARVEFSKYDEALSALTKSHRQIGNNEILVTLLENCTLWITNFPPQFNHRDIRNLFKENGITVLSVRLPSLRFNANRRFAYVDVSTTKEVGIATASLHCKEIEGYKLVVKQSNPLERSKRSDASVWERREILVRHLDPNKVTEDSLRQFYSKYGTIDNVRILKSDERVDYAFISFIDHESALRALETNKSQLEGGEITVTLADRKAYLERQEVKKILQKSGISTNDLIVSLYPFSDKVNKTQIQKLLEEKASVNEDDIKKIHLVPDLAGSLIVFNNTIIAAKCSLALNGTSFQNTILHCGTVKDLRKSIIKSRGNHTSENHSLQTKSKSTSAQLSNDDFRKLFLGQ